MTEANTTRTAHRRPVEFGGPVGNLIMMIFLPVIVYYLYYSVMFHGGVPVPKEWFGDPMFSMFLDSIKPTPVAVIFYVGWFLFQALLQALLPGSIALGKPLADGTRLRYRMNGPASLAVTAATVALLVGFGCIAPTVIYDNLGALISVVMIFSYLFAVFLYFHGKKTGPADERTGNILYDYFMGASVNPRIGSFDLKFFCEARPGLMLWILADLSFLAAQYQDTGSVSAALVLVTAMQAWYVIDYYLHEPAILTTMDIAYENFGLMLAFGDLAWVPFTYSIQALYLVKHSRQLPVWGILAILALNAAGYYIFRTVNLQKHRFRADPARKIWGRDPEYIETKGGGKLLVSGFWGCSRHFNYVGDILMAVAWSLPTLFATPLTWFYPVYFTILLVHRERRDNRHCSSKYGDDWSRYCERVPWRIIPRIY
jgi:delta14-sterol reductase